MSAPRREPTVICFPFVGDLVGGSHISALGLIRRLDPARFAPLVVLHRTEGPVAELFRREGVAFEAAPAVGHLTPAETRRGRAAAHLLRAVPALARFLRSRRAAIVHTNDGRVHVTWGTAARLAGARVLWHQRGDPRAFGLRRLAPWVAHRVVAVSRFASPRPGPFSAGGKCSVVHSPFDVAPRAPERAARRSALVAELGCPPETLLLGYVGTLVERKRPLLFVEAVAALRAKAPDLPVMGLFFGDALHGLDAAALERAAALGVADRVRLMGFRYPGEPWLAALDQLLVTAVDEPFGRTLIEAMLLGTPVIAAASGGNPEAIRHGETGLLVPPDDPGAFAAAALALRGEPALRAALVEAAGRDVRVRFGIERHVAAVTRIYDELLARRDPGPRDGPG